MLLGLTGGYCAGKNAVATLLEARGWTCIDVDKLGHEAIEFAKAPIVSRFGVGVLGSDGRVDRRALARIVFTDPEALAAQEAIVHPIAISLLEERIAAAEATAKKRGQSSRICINAALLHRTDRLASCDAIIEVRAPCLLRIVRGMRRDGGGMLATFRRIVRQRNFHVALYSAAHIADRPIFLLYNATGRTALRNSVDRVLARIESKAQGVTLGR